MPAEVQKAMDYLKNAYRTEGRAEGKAEGILDTLINLVNKGLISIKDAAEQGKMSEKEFKKLLTA